MKRSLFIKYVLPYIQWYALMIFLSIVIDYFLYRFQLVHIGRYLGPIGSMVIICVFTAQAKNNQIWFTQKAFATARISINNGRQGGMLIPSLYKALYT